MRIKLIYSSYDKETGLSYARIRTDLGEFEGYSLLHEEDRDIASTYAGCQYAETRAVLKYMKQRIKNLSLQIQALINYQKQLEGRAAYNPQSVEGRALRKQIFILKAEKKDWQARYTSLKDKLYASMMSRKDVIKKILPNRKEEN